MNSVGRRNDRTSQYCERATTHPRRKTSRIRREPDMPAWEGTIPIYINNFNWLTWTRELASFFDDVAGVEVIIIDNASTYPPLLEWYDTQCRYRVVRLEYNHGCHAPWTSGTVLPREEHRSQFGSDYYIVTDPDLNFTGCPKDVVNVLVEGYERYPEITKVGVSLEIDDLPTDSLIGKPAAEWESQFWQRRRDSQFFDAGVDTTFGLYGAGVPCVGNCLRSDRPYTVRHEPWYLTSANLTEEHRFYFQNASFGHWTAVIQRLDMRDCFD